MAKSAQPKSTGIRTDDRLKNSRQFKGIRMRNWGKWVSEIRMPNSRARIWLGSYDTPEQAARAYDAAVYCLRGKKATFNFPDTPPEIPSALSLSPNQIQAAAARFAVAGFPSPSPSVNDSAEPLSPSPSVSSSSSPPSGSEIESPIEGEFWESLLADFQHSHFSNLDIFLPLNVSMSVLPFPSPSLKEGSFTFYQTDSWRDSWRL